MERTTSLYFEILVAKEYGLTYDEWLKKPKLIRNLHVAHHRIYLTKEAYWNTPKDKRFGFLANKD